MSTVHVVVPEGVDDVRRPSGGNTYDRRVCAGLGALGLGVREVAVPGTWPRADRAAHRRLATELAAVPDRSVVLLDGIVASSAPDVLASEAGRLRLVAVVHLPLGIGIPGAEASWAVQVDRAAERAALGVCRTVVATSRWTRAWLRVHYGLPASRVAVVHPGTDAAPLTVPVASGGRLLCVGALTPTKGQDVLVGALAGLADLAWTCTLVGSCEVDRAFAGRLMQQVADAGAAGRVHVTGALTRDELEPVWRHTDLLVVPSRTETYGLVVSEALARGVPVVGSDVGGLPESLGHDDHGRRPGVLVTADDTAALAAAVQEWLGDDVLRSRLRRAARSRRVHLHDWSVTSADLAGVLSAVAA